MKSKVYPFENLITSITYLVSHQYMFSLSGKIFWQ